MKNPVQAIINAVLLISVAVLFYLQMSRPVAPTTAAKSATPATLVADTATRLPQPATTEMPVAEAPDAAPTTEAPAVALDAAGAGTQKIAYVESGRLLEGYQGMKDARRAFEAKAKGWERQNAALVSTFQAALEDYKKKAPAMSAEMRATAEGKLQELQQSSGQQQEKIQRQAQEEEGKLTATVLESVNKKVEAYGKAHGYTLILIAAPSGTIAYGRKDLDITTPVVAYLNQNYRK